MFERPWSCRKCFANRAIPSVEHSAGRATMRAPAFILDPSILFFAGHSRAKIWQVKPGARDRHCNPVPCIEAEEPDSGFAIGHDVGTYIQFRKRGEQGSRGRASQSYAGHPKWHDAKPCLPFESIDLQFRRDMPAQYGLIDAPVSKKQVVPALRHDPGARRQRPWSVGNLLRIGAHWDSLVSLDIAIVPIYPSLSLANRILSIQIKRTFQKERHHATESIGGLARRVERRQGFHLHSERGPERYPIFFQHAL